MGDRLLNPVFDLIIGALTSRALTGSTIFLGSLGVSVIICATIFGVILLQRFNKWRTRHSQSTPKTPETLTPAGFRPESAYGYMQKNYRRSVRDDLFRIRQELYPTTQRRDIQFKSWNSFPKPDPRKDWIDNQPQFDAIENFSRTLNNRNDNLKDITLDDDCIAEYVNVRKTGFLDDVLTVESPKYVGRLDGDIQLIYDTRVLNFYIQSTTNWFEVGLRNSRKLTIQKSLITKGTMLPLEQDADLAGQYFRIRHEDSLEVTVTATFEFYSADFVVVVLRKGDQGVLTVQVLDENGKKLGPSYSYSHKRNSAKNHVEFSRISIVTIESQLMHFFCFEIFA